jgi:hypothetical protein
MTSNYHTLSAHRRSAWAVAFEKEEDRQEYEWIGGTVVEAGFARDQGA